MNFLERIVDDVFKNIENKTYGDNCTLSDIAFVFPTRRAGFYFRKFISERIRDKPIWSPDQFSIIDFIKEVSRKNFPDQLNLLFELFEIYKEIPDTNPRSFDQFYPWGKMVLSDFNDIDQNIINTDIFREILEFSSENDDNENIIFKNYNDLIQILNTLYSGFKNKLENSNSTYYGLAVRDLILNLQTSNKNDPFSKWKKIIFAGFSFLTKGEEKLFSILKENNKGIFYWDIDDYFYSDPNNEAGTYFRSSTLIDDNSNWIDHHLKESAKNIEIIGSPGKVGQAKIAGNLLENFSNNKKNAISFEKTAVILSDETLLFPLLNSIPGSIPKINISMGSPIKDSPPYNFIFLILRIISEKNSSVNEEDFLFEDIKKILLHPYLLSSFPVEIEHFITAYSKLKLPYISLEKLRELGDRIHAVFCYSMGNNPFDLFQYIENIILLIKNTLILQDKKIELEYLFAFFKQFTRIRDLFLKYKPGLDLKNTLKILKDSLENTVIPFSGEPLNGLQIIGMLETRAVDFENIYILSMNEGIFPKGKTSQSLIPNDIRKSRGMSYFEKRDAIFAYYFYRIIKEAKNVTIIYNTESDKFSKGEKSRFIEQLNYEFRHINRNSNFTDKIITIEADFSIAKSVEIYKSDKIIDLLKNLSFSASSLNKYLYCSLSFYYRYILKLKEAENLDLTVDPRGFGTLMHEILEFIYKPFIDKEINREDILEITQNLEPIIERYFYESLKINNTRNGKNYINKIIIHKLLKTFLNNESKELPFKILGLEARLNRNFEITLNDKNELINIYGAIDRIDEKEDSLRILDYKTGQLNSLKNTIILTSTREEIIEQVSAKKEILQLMIYNFLINGDRAFNKYDKIRFGITYFKSLSKGTEYIDSFNSKAEFNDVSEFVISTVLKDLFNRDLPFSQTENKENCKHCPYKDICYR